MASVTTHPGQESAWLQDRLSSPWQSLGAVLRADAEAPDDERLRAGRLVRALESEVIPRLVQARRQSETPVAEAPPLSEADLQAFVARVLEDRPGEVAACVAQWRRRGLSVSRIYLELLAPAARRLGSLWEEDLCDFPGVTVGLGRLQRLLRELTDAFDAEPSAMAPAQHQAGGLRLLLTQPPREQHGFGLSMVAAFFRRDGWLVEGGVGGLVPPLPALRVQEEWFDAIGFSIGSQTLLPWLQEQVAAVRSHSRNPALVVLVGGPLLMQQPACLQALGADACLTDASQAPSLAAGLVAQRAAAR